MTEMDEGPKVVSTVQDVELVEARRDQICRAAVELSRRLGFGSVTTRKIASQAGMNIATMYQYVSSKEDIIFLVCQTNVKRMQRELSTSEKDPVRRLESRFRNLIHVAHERQFEVTFVYQESRTLNDKYLEAVKAWDELLVDHFEEALRAAVAAGQGHVSDTRIAARALVETGYAWANKAWSMRPLVTWERYADLHWDWFVRAFVLEEGLES